jgi:hypothetical protein
MSEMDAIEIEVGNRSACEAARAAVAEGAADAMVRFTRDGKAILYGRLYRCAALRVVEEPDVHFTWWRPHPMATPNARVLEVVAAERASAAQAREARKRRHAS